MKISKLFFFFLIGIILSFIVLELFFCGTKSIGLSATDWTEKGRRLKKNWEIISFNEGFGITKTNNYGYISSSKIIPQEDIRIALIGDSFVEGRQVFLRDHFSSVLEKNLEIIFM